MRNLLALVLAGYVNFAQPSNVVGIDYSVTQRTFSAWFKSTTPDGTILSIAEQTNRPLLMFIASGLPMTYIGGNNMIGAGNYGDSAWHHMVVAVRASGNSRLWVDGVSKANTTARKPDYST